MKKFYLFILPLFIFFSTFLLGQQNYQSIFGQNSTMWVFETCNFPGCYQDTVYAVKDTIINGYTWKKLAIKTIGYQYEGGVLREDTILGKVWYKALADPTFIDTTTQLIFDYSLELGDTFELKCIWGDPPVESEIVDTIYYINGQKYIGFIQRHLNSGERYTFIEGVGSIFGVLQNHVPTLLTAQYLLCSYKDGIQSYTNIKYNGDCDIHDNTTSLSNINNQPIIKLFPNPVQSILNIEIINQQDFLEEIKIYNTFGQLFVSKSNFNASRTLNVSDLPTGMYYVQLTTNNLKIYQQPFFKQ